MRKRKKIQALEQEIEMLNSMLSRIDNCNECGAVYNNEHMQRVTRESRIFGAPLETQIQWYCAKHKKPYDKIINGEYFKTNIEVTKKGKPIKK